MAASAQFKEYLLELFEPVAPVTIRSMFGGLGVFKETSKGRLMFGLVAQEVIYLKTGEETRVLCKEMKLEPFEFVQKGERRIMTGYYALPEICFDDADELKIWAMRAIDTAIAAKK